MNDTFESREVWRWKYVPGCQCGDCQSYAEEQKPENKFRAMEDERAEFETTFRDIGYDLARNVNKFHLPETALNDYFSIQTASAWRGWLLHARVEWVPTP